MVTEAIPKYSLIFLHFIHLRLNFLNLTVWNLPKFLTVFFVQIFLQLPDLNLFQFPPVMIFSKVQSAEIFPSFFQYLLLNLFGILKNSDFLMNIPHYPKFSSFDYYYHHNIIETLH